MIAFPAADDDGAGDDTENTYLFSRVYQGVPGAPGQILTTPEGYLGVGLFGVADDDSAGYGLVLQFDQAGIPQWSRLWTSELLHQVTSVVALPTGGYAVAGWTSSGPDTSEVMLALIPTPPGTQVTVRTFGTTQGAIAGRAVTNTTDGGLLVAGYGQLTHEGRSDCVVLRTDSGGHLQWAKTISGNRHLRCLAVAETTGGVILLGGDAVDAQEDADLIVIRLDADGQLIDAKQFGGSGHDWFGGLSLAAGGAFSVVGLSSDSTIEGAEMDAVVVRFEGADSMPSAVAIETGLTELPPDPIASVVSTSDARYLMTFRMAMACTSGGPSEPEQVLAEVDVFDGADPVIWAATHVSPGTWFGPLAVRNDYLVIAGSSEESGSIWMLSKIGHLGGYPDCIEPCGLTWTTPALGVMPLAEASVSNWQPIEGEEIVTAEEISTVVLDACQSGGT